MMNTKLLAVVILPSIYHKENIDIYPLHLDLQKIRQAQTTIQILGCSAQGVAARDSIRRLTEVSTCVHTDPERKAKSNVATQNIFNLHILQKKVLNWHHEKVYDPGIHRMYYE